MTYTPHTGQRTSDISRLKTVLKLLRNISPGRVSKWSLNGSYAAFASVLNSDGYKVQW